MFSIRTATPEDADRVAELIHHSTNHWYESHGFGKIFQGDPQDCRLFFDVYEDLDPGCCLLAEDNETQELIGSCFYHPRATHVSLGIMNSAAGVAGKGVAKGLLEEICHIADKEGKPLRLFSSAMNLDSYSLYNRREFAPYAAFQDMLLTVPEEGIHLEDVPLKHVRTATLDDVSAIAALEESVWGIQRYKDWEYFIRNKRGIWHVSVCEQGGEIQGVLGSVNHPASNMIGPGIMHDPKVAAALVVNELNQYPGQTPVFLVPADQCELLQLMYSIGARNCELHFGQSRGLAPKVHGIVMPTFMPETG